MEILSYLNKKNNSEFDGKILNYQAHSDFINKLKTTIDGGMILSCSEDFTSKLFSLDKNKPIRVFNSNSAIVDCYIDKYYSNVCCVNDNNLFNIWDVRQGKCSLEIDLNSFGNVINGIIDKNLIKVMLKNGNAIILDVRNIENYVDGHNILNISEKNNIFDKADFSNKNLQNIYLQIENSKSSDENFENNNDNIRNEHFGAICSNEGRIKIWNLDNLWNWSKETKDILIVDNDFNKNIHGCNFGVEGILGVLGK